MTRVNVVAATGQVGTGFLEESLTTAARSADVIGCDGGSSDPGPYYLGSGEAQASPDALERDLELMLEAAIRADVPLVIGSAGTAGGAPHLDLVRGLVTSIAARHRWHFRLGCLGSEIDAEAVAADFRRGAVTPLPGAPPLSEETILRTRRIVAMMGVEPIQKALSDGVRVVLCGRSSDVSIFAALPVMRGAGRGAAYHAAKVLECGASAVERKAYPDAMCASIRDDHFEVEPPNPDFRCTPQSVAAHTLHENADPFRLVEPGGVLDMSEAVYTQSGARAVRVSGSRFHQNDDYTVRLEGAALTGYRSVAFAGIRDPLVVGRVEDFLADVTSTVRRKVRDSLGLDQRAYSLTWRVYGVDGVLGALERTVSTPHEVGVLLDIVSPEQRRSSAICAIAWHTALHHPIAEYSGGVSHLAFPFSPPTMEAGPVYEFSLNHVLHLTDPCAPFQFAYENV
ncbi:MAG TPA: acyclic terpene utilization AtuA family protein [Mycobacteriales bacterium]|nr:acyclic terpene utilization AtuA family protein [Mycobacteriales bacterium]